MWAAHKFKGNRRIGYSSVLVNRDGPLPVVVKIELSGDLGCKPISNWEARAMIEAMLNGLNKAKNALTDDQRADQEMRTQ